jgi:hypothetical protein
MKIAAALTICCILALGSFQEGAAQEPTKAFRVHYIGGPADFTGEHLELTVTPQALLMEGKAGKQRKSVSIPLDGIIVVVHSPLRFSRSHQVGTYMPYVGFNPGKGSGWGAGAGDILVFAAWGAYNIARLMTLGMAGSTHGQKHFVTILWQKEGVEREWVVEAGKDDYRPLLQQLEAFSGKKYVDLEAQYHRFEEGIKREKDNAVSVSLDRQVKLGTETLPPGSYRLVLLDGEEGHGELYFFAGKEITDANLKGVAVVEVGPGTVGPVEVVYNSRVSDRISEVRTPAKTFRLESEVETSALLSIFCPDSVPVRDPFIPTATTDRLAIELL